MSIERYAVIETALCIGGNLHEGEVMMVRADEHDQEIAALREELAEIKESLAYRGSLLGRTEARMKAAEQRNATRDIESAAKVLANCMDYPWEHMPENGRASMRKHAQAVIDAALAQPTESGASE